MRLIDADALKKQLEDEMYDDDEINDSVEQGDSVFLKSWNKGIKRAIVRLKSMTTVDPVKHGHWIMKEAPIMPQVDECDQCRFSVPFGHGFKYCPMCGAKMEEKDD